MLGARIREVSDRLTDRQALACVLQNCIDLSPGDAGNPLQKVDHGGTALEILEESTHRHPRGTEQPFSADLARSALHRGTARPTEHGAIYSVVGPIRTPGPPERIAFACSGDVSGI